MDRDAGVDRTVKLGRRRQARSFASMCLRASPLTRPLMVGIAQQFNGSVEGNPTTAGGGRGHPFVLGGGSWPVLAGLRVLTVSALRRAARDRTDDCEQRSALVLAPHPDDETLGCGATIMRKLAAGRQVTVAVATDGRYSHRSNHVTPEQLADLRRVEMEEAGRRLGLSTGDIRWGGFVDGIVGAAQRLLLEHQRQR